MQRIDWQQIDHVLLDMDGTLLDLHFDNYFWQVFVASAYAKQHTLSATKSKQYLDNLYQQYQGKLSWYCLDFWSEQLDLDIVALKQPFIEKIQYLPNAQAFLQQLKQRSVQIILATNAHQDSIQLKQQQTGLLQYFDRVVSAHQLGFAKEQIDYWVKIKQQENLDFSRCLFVDDNDTVLQTAKQMGIRFCFSIAKPDSCQPQREEHNDFIRLTNLLDLFHE